MGEETRTIHETMNACSVEISRGSNGQVTIGVKAYGPDVASAYAQVKAQFVKADADFPFTKGGK